MTQRPERWQRLREIFDGARVLPAERREQFVVASCDGDDALLRDVEALLVSHDHANSFLETPLAWPIDHDNRLPTRRTEAALAIGTTFDRYRISRSLAEGGMGQVYLAEDTRLGRFVALKLLPPAMAQDGERLHRFEREARLASSLNHPNVAQIYDLGTFKGHPFITMEYVDGSTLDAAGTRPFGSALVADIAGQVCSALEAAHAKGIVHRDVKPLNIMLTPRGHVKVLDFGVATIESSGGRNAVDGSRFQTQTGHIMGTLPYMSPEQVCGERLGSASDIFSLGVVLYWLATGRHPFMVDALAGNTQALTHAIVTHSAVPPLRHNPAIPLPLDELILRMLGKDPRLRPSAAEVKRLMSGQENPTANSRRKTAAGRQFLRHTVGRKREGALLEEAFQEAAAGQPLLLTVAGEPGIGKTTVVEEFLYHVTANDRGVVARGRCSERLAGSDAYLPVLEALDSFLSGDRRHTGAPLMAQFAPTWYAQISPAKAETAFTVGAQLELKNASQERMKRELRAFLDEISRVTPVVLFFDDLHWADLSTVDLLGYLCTQFGSMRLLIVVTYRPTDLLLAKHPFVPLKLDLFGARSLPRDLARLPEP